MAAYPHTAVLLSLAIQMKRIHFRSTRGLWDRRRWGNPPYLNMSSNRNRDEGHGARDPSRCTGSETGDSSTATSTTPSSTTTYNSDIVDWGASVASPDGTVLIAESAHLHRANMDTGHRDSVDNIAGSGTMCESDIDRCSTNSERNNMNGSEECFTMRQSWNNLR
jgi:hypothetical protein